MGTVTIAGTGYNDFLQAFVAGANFPADGIYYPTGNPPDYGQPPQESDPQYDRRQVKFAGVAGQGEKDFGFLRRQIWIDLIFVGDKSGVETAKAALLATLATNTRYTIAMPGGASRQGCKLRPIGRSTQKAIGEKICLCVPFTFEQLSESN